MAIKISGSTIIDDGRSLVNVGVSTISGDLHVGTGVTVFSSTGIVSATAYHGDGSNLDGVGFKPDAQENLVAGTDAGANLTSDSCYNVAIGHKALSNYASDGTFVGCNVAIGNCAGFTVTGTSINGLGNVYVGNSAGRCHNGNNSVFVGHMTMAVSGPSGVTGGTDSVVVGAHAGRCIKTNNQNVFIGCGAGYHSCSGGSNTYVGDSAGLNNRTGGSNVYIGRCAGKGCTQNSAQANVSVGSYSGFCLTTGQYNIFLGVHAGRDNTTGNNNVVIGYCHCAASAVGDCQLSIGLSGGSDYWIRGDSSKTVCLAGTNAIKAVNSGGVFCATCFLEDGSPVGFTPDAQENLVAGTDAGAGRDTDTCYNIMIGQEVGCKVNAGDNNVMIGWRA